ncbi:hypothetical protein CAEBREN_05405 [Caenorhabditis brenneri]|uniref:Uncharacterized protein n=1 Tax=Caenorhabditis brenneri TaxID=135651 RepID=G0P448_CAEBE|nr:hypothetical protein CAEBREN_05405 [Caenorhabditis brenneri]
MASFSSSISTLILATFVIVSVVMVFLILCQPGALPRLIGVKQCATAALEAEKMSNGLTNNIKAQVGSTAYNHRAVPLIVVLCGFSIFLLGCTLVQNVYARIFENKESVLGYILVPKVMAFGRTASYYAKIALFCVVIGAILIANPIVLPFLIKFIIEAKYSTQSTETNVKNDTNEREATKEGTTSRPSLTFFGVIGLFLCVAILLCTFSNDEDMAAEYEEKPKKIMSRAFFIYVALFVCVVIAGFLRFCDPAIFPASFGFKTDDTAKSLTMENFADTATVAPAQPDSWVMEIVRVLMMICCMAHFYAIFDLCFDRYVHGEIEEEFHGITDS